MSADAKGAKEPAKGGKAPGDPPRDASRWVALVAVSILTLALVLDNFQNVEVGFLFGSTEAPLVVVLLVAWALGLAIGFLLGRRRKG